MTAADSKGTNEQKVIEALAAMTDGTIDEVATAAGIGRTSARKYLVDLERRGKVARIGGGRDGKRKFSDRFSQAEAEPIATPTEDASELTRSPERLRPGGLDELVITFMREHPTESPFGTTAVAKGLGRSSGAVANCMSRLASAGKLTQAHERPRRYTLLDGAPQARVMNR